MCVCGIVCGLCDVSGMCMVCDMYVYRMCLCVMYVWCFSELCVVCLYISVSVFCVYIVFMWYGVFVCCVWYVYISMCL